MTTIKTRETRSSSYYEWTQLANLLSLIPTFGSFQLYIFAKSRD